MKELTLEHLSAHLPYGIDVVNAYGNVVKNISPNTFIGEYNVFIGLDKDCKLILRPLSDLYKEENSIGGAIAMRTYNMLKRGHNVYTLSFGIVSDLCKYHYDVFNLIPQGLAISIHDIKQ